MIIIGEKLNGSIPSVGEAIQRRDAGFIRELAKLQVEAGADYLDLCTGTSADKELEDLCWLIDIVQEAEDILLCVDSHNANIFSEVLPRIKRSGIINSVSGEGDKCDVIFPLLKENDWLVIALTCDEKGVPSDAGRKVEIAVRLVEKAADYDIGPERIFVDPLVMALSAVNDSMINFMEAVREIKSRYPTIKTTSGLSNISYGAPYRKIINLTFLTLALSAGIDSAIIDPTNRDTYATILAAEALLNKDRFLRKYSKAYRAGKIGQVKAGR